MVTRDGGVEREAAHQSRGTRLAALLFALLGPPVAWSAHFGAIYLIVAVTCAAGGASVLLPIGAATLAAVAVNGAAGLVALRLWREGSEGDGEGTRRLVLIMGMLGVAFFTGVIVLETLPPLFLPPCPVGGP